jgi:archaellum component FlaC
VDEIAARPPVAPEIADQLSELSAHVESITAAAATSEEALVDLRAQLAALAASHDAADAVSDADPELDRRLDNVVARLDALHARVEEVATAAAPHDVVEEAPKPDLVAVLREELESRIEALASRTDGVAQEAAGAVEALASERDALEARVEALARELADARSQADTQAPAPPAAEPAPPAKEKARDDSEPQGVEAELERLRMAVERINMHLGERERAITDLMRSRSAELTLEELAGRIAELERGGAAAGSTAAPAGDAETSVELRALASRLEEAEQSAKADRDKLLTQLERMASSIDWRFRRIESGESDAAA